MSEPLLSVKNLKTYFYTEDGVMPSVDGIDFDLAPGETLAIVGESGCGKSVTSLSIMRLIQSPPGKIVDGEILYNGQDLLKKSAKEMRAIVRSAKSAQAGHNRPQKADQVKTIEDRLPEDVRRRLEEMRRAPGNE